MWTVREKLAFNEVVCFGGLCGRVLFGSVRRNKSEAATALQGWDPVDLVYMYIYVLYIYIYMYIWTYTYIYVYT